MKRAIYVHDDRGLRVYQPGDFPLQLGGDGADIRLDGVDGASLGQIGLSGGVPYLSVDQAVRINGSRFDDSCWLGDGAVAVLDEAHVVSRLGPDAITLYARSRTRAQTPPPQADDDEHVVVQPVAFHPGSGGDRPRHHALRFAQAAVALLGVVAWFLFTARSLDIAIDPQPRQVAVQGSLFTARIGGRYLLRPGEYTVRAELDGYQPLSEVITVGVSSNQQVALQMQKLPGLLDVTTGQLTGAEVLIDGEAVGATPLAGAEVAPGLRSLIVKARNHLPYQQEIEIEGMGRRQTLALTLAPNWAPVTVTTTPPGAAVSVDDLALGATPLTAEVEAGARTVQISLPGYKPVERTVVVAAGEPVTLADIELAEADGIVDVVSTPAGASVTVDGAFAGRTPLQLALRPGVGHRIALSKPGYEGARRAVELEPEEQRPVNVSLTPILGSVRIVASPEDAQLLVDGRPSGPANQVLSLTAAPHQIEIRKQGYAPHTETVTPRRGLEQRLTVVLQTVAEAQAARLDAVITTSAAQTLRLIPTGSLQMGSPRREQGRRSNEIRRDVQLTREFYISETEVTNRQFREFMAHNSGFFGGLSLEGDEQPVVRLGWQQAARYCNWLSDRDGLPRAYTERDGRLVARRPMTTGYRMPTEAEWAWVARFEGGARPLKYVWGDQLPPPPGAANLADNAARSLVAQRVRSYDDGYSVSAPVGSFAPNKLGLRDLGGNVAEWVNDVYEASSVDPFVSLVDPLGPDNGSRYVIRGASWAHGGITELRTAFRDYGAGGREDVGFRIARYAR